MKDSKMENEEIFYLQIYKRILIIVFDIFICGATIFSIIIKWDYSYFFLIYIVIFIPFTLWVFVKYTFTYNQIIIKYPLLREQKILLKEIDGFSLMKNTHNSYMIFYSKEKRKIIMINDKIIKTKINNLIENNYDGIKNRNINLIKTSGLICFLKRNKNAVFYRDKFTINEKEYYYKTNIKDIKYLDYTTLDYKLKTIIIKTDDDKVIQINNIGLYEYLLKEIKLKN
jgi:hypothetical protein